MNALAVIGGLAVAGGIGYVIYANTKKSATSTTTSTTTNVTTPAAAVAACNQAQLLVNMRRANPTQDASVTQTPYNYWANLCSQNGGTPPAWPG